MRDFAFKVASTGCAVRKVGSGEVVARADDADMAARIALCWNSHQALLSALNKAVVHVHPDLPEFAECEQVIVAVGGTA